MEIMLRKVCKIVEVLCVIIIFVSHSVTIHSNNCRSHGTLVTSHHGATAAAVHFSRKFYCCVQPSTVHCIKEVYLNKIKKMRLIGNIESLTSSNERQAIPP